MYSVYIPNIPVLYNDNMIREIFNTFQVGAVERVDFLPPHEHNTRIRKAFVHFNPYNNSRMTTLIHQHSNNEPFRLIVDGQGHYWDLCQNKRPVPESELNIHQLAENMRIMQTNFETKIAELTAKVAVIPKLQEEMANLQSRIRYLEDPEWLTSTGNGFQSDPLTISMLNESMDNDCNSNYDSEDYDDTVVHPCDEEVYENAMASFHQDEDEEYEYDSDYHATSNACDLTLCTPIDIVYENTDVSMTPAEFRTEIENHFINERDTAIAVQSPPPLVRMTSMHYYDDEIAMVSSCSADENTTTMSQMFEMECV